MLPRSLVQRRVDQGGEGDEEVGASHPGAGRRRQAQEEKEVLPDGLLLPVDLQVTVRT